MARRKARKAIARLVGEMTKGATSNLARLSGCDGAKGAADGVFNKATANRVATIRSESGRWGARDSRYEADVALREERGKETSVMD